MNEFPVRFVPGAMVVKKIAVIQRRTAAVIVALHPPQLPFPTPATLPVRSQ